VGAKLFHADRQTHNEARSRFPNFAKSPKSSTLFRSNFRPYTGFPTLKRFIKYPVIYSGKQGVFSEKKTLFAGNQSQSSFAVLSSSNKHALQAGEAAGEASCTASNKEHAL